MSKMHPFSFFFLQVDCVLLPPEQKAGSNLRTSFTWHLLPPGSAGISKRKYPTPSQGKGVLRPAYDDLPDHVRTTLQLSTCRPSLGGNQLWCRTPSRVGYLMLWGQLSAETV